MREHVKVRQRIVRHLGVAESDLPIERLKACGDALIAELLVTSKPYIFPPEELAEEIRRAQAQRQGDWELTVRRATTGIHEVYGRIHQDLGQDRLLPAYRYPASSRSLHHCVMARLADPKSKLATSAQLSEDFGVSLQLQKLCPMMDQLDGECREKLQRLAWKAAPTLFREPVEMVIFDCTTLHFESFVRDGLKQPGCGKDAKIKESQTVLALFVSGGGLPLGYELFPGSTAETSSLIPAVSKMKARFDVRNMPCVADRGMMSASNLAALEAAGMDWIVGARLRSLRQGIQHQALDLESYVPTSLPEVRILDLELDDGRRLVVSHSRTRKDRRGREEMIEKLRRRLGRGRSPVPCSATGAFDGS